MINVICKVARLNASPTGSGVGTSQPDSVLAGK